MKWIMSLALLTMATAAFCSPDKTTIPVVNITAMVIDGYCVENRSARAPAAYYTSDIGKRQMQEYFKRMGDQMPVFKLAPELVSRIHGIAFSSTRIDPGNVNFFVRFFDEDGKNDSRAITREKLGEIIDCLPEGVRANLSSMQQHG